MFTALICALLLAIASCGNGKTNPDVPSTPSAPSTPGTPDTPDTPDTDEDEEPAASEGLLYELNSDRESYSVRALGSCTDADIVIPSTYNGKPVTGINAEVFYYLTSITSITVPDSIKSVGDHAFPDHDGFKYNEYDNAYYLGNKNNPYLYLVKAKSTDITSVSIHGDTKFVYWHAFMNCSKLAQITVPSGVVGIGKMAFSGCRSLTDITLPDSVSEIGESAFYACTGLSKITLPAGMTSISASTFSGCSALTNIIIPDSVTKIGDDAFKTCGALTYTEYDNAFYLGNTDNPYLFLMKPKNADITSVTIHSDTKNVYQSAFKDCKSLKSVTVPSGVARIEYSAFYGCSALKSVYINDITSWFKIKFGDAYSNPVTVAKKLYLNNSLVKKLTVPDGITEIGDYALYNCTGITEIKIPSSVTKIGAGAFSGCSGLNKITLPDSVTCIEDRAFYGCSALTDIKIPNNVTSIGNEIFYSANKLNYTEYGNAYYIGNDVNPYLILVKAKDKNITSVQIHSDTKFIHSSAFYNCKSLASVTVLGSVKSICSEAFSGCSKLTSIEIPEGITDIGTRAFALCSGLTSIVIGSGLTNISEYAFISCGKLTSITLPEELKTVEAYAFEKCGELTHITFQGTRAQWNAIYKYGNWNSSIKRICCTDGDITL